MLKLERTVALVGLFLIAACGSKGCSCAQPIKGGYPVAERHEGAIQVRATQSLFQFFSDNGAKILPTLLPGGTTFNVPPQCSAPAGTKICCATPAPMCRLQITFTNVVLKPTAPNAVQLDADFELKTLDNLPVGILGGTCMISIDSTRTGGPTMHISAPIALPVDMTTDLTNVTIDSTKVTVNGLDSGDVNDNESGSTPLLCGTLNIFNSVIVPVLEGQISGQLSGAVSGQTCMSCTTKDDCNSFASACTSGQCVDTKGNCIQEIGLESKMDVGSALASFAPGTQATMDVLAVLGGWSVADTGLSLGMLGGGRGDPHSPCVSAVPAPSPTAIPPSTTFFTDVLPDGAEPFHLGIGVHKSELDALGWGAFDSGALCLHIGTATVAQLSAKTVGLIIPSLADLVHLPDAPLFLSFRPAQPPTFALGKGTFKVDPTSGVKTIDDPLMRVQIANFAIDFYAFVDDRYVRIMTLTSDIDLPISLDVDAMGQLVPLIGDVSSAFTNLRVSNSELLAESPEDLAQSFPTLLGVAVGTLTSSLKPIALPSLMGLNLLPKSITTTDPDAHGNNQFLSIFADLAVATPLERAADTTAQLVSLTLPPTAGFAVTGRGGVVPSATLQLGGRSLDRRALEWSWALDGGAWSPFGQSETLVIRDPRLWLQGRHFVDVRARATGWTASLDDTPARVELLVDTVPPEGSFAGDGSITASDRVSPASALLYRWRDGGAWSDWSPTPRVALATGRIPHAEVQAQDEAGNVGGLEFHGRTTNPPSSSGCGCHVGGASPAGGVLAFVLVLGLLGRRRVLLLLALLAGCNEAHLGKGDFEDPLHEIGRYHDIAFGKGVFHVSAYDDSTGDLVYARITDPKQSIGWQVVDGIDPTAVADMPGGYRHGVSDPGPDVGLYSSIALTRSGAPRIAYYDVSNGALKLAEGPHPFRVSTVQAGDGKNLKVGLYSRISLDANDIPTIAYMATGISDGKGGFTSELRVATADGPSPSKDTDWKVTVVDSTRIRCGGLCPSGQACIEAAMVNGMPNGDPSQSSCTATTNDCNPACATGDACLMGTCVTPEAAPDGDLPEGIGLFTNLFRQPSGLVLVYHDRSQGDLKMASQSGGSYSVSLLDGGDPATDRGQFCSAEYGPDGTLHIAYVDAIADQLLYMGVSSASPTPAPEVVDNGLRPDGPHSVGAGASLYVDGSAPEIVYQDQVTSDLLIARGGGPWAWVPLREGLPGYGWWPHLVSDGKQVWMSHFVYDRAAGNPIGNFVLEPLAAPGIP
jgi:MYXO-CTERM domain-containing protein